MDPINTLAVVTVLAGIVSKIVERIRARIPTLDGDLVTLAAWVLGGLAAWALGLQGAKELLATAGIDLGSIPAALDYILTGLGIAAGAGIFADVTGRSGAGRTLTLVDDTQGGRHALPDNLDDAN